MPSWLFLVILVAVFFGINPIFHNEAIKVHGPVVHLVISHMAFGILVAIWLVFFQLQDLHLVTKKSFYLAATAGVISFIAVAALFSAYKIAPAKLSVITITASFSVVILAIINHLLGSRLNFHQWVGAVITFLGIILVNYKK